VLYPHFQAAVVPGWLDKHLKRRHRATARLANVIVLTPDPAWVRTLPNGKLSDRRDFKHYGTDTRARVAAWSRALRESERLRDDFATWAHGVSGYAAQPLRRTPPARISESGCIQAHRHRVRADQTPDPRQRLRGVAGRRPPNPGRPPAATLTQRTTP